MYCSRCGQQIPGDSLFCPECGHGLQEKAAVAVQEAPKGVSVGIAVGTVVFPLVGIVAAALLWRDPDPGKRRNARTYLWLGLGAIVAWILLMASLGSGYEEGYYSLLVPSLARRALPEPSPVELV